MIGNAETSDWLSYSDDGELVAVFVKMPIDLLVTLNFLLESYDGLGVVRTLDASHGEIVILSTCALQAELHKFIASVKDGLRMQITDPPASLARDWLLAEISHLHSVR